MTGEIILINKPFRWTSFDVVRKLRNVLSKPAMGRMTQHEHPSTRNPKFKIGHAGTLDPLATGLLILCTGKMTKKISEIQDAEKEYTATFAIGSTTPSYDLETELSEAADYSHVNEKIIMDAVRKFTGKILQTPPAHSAVKIGGVRAYTKARKGEVVEIKAKEVHIREFEITAFRLPEIDVRIVCTKGTYIRSLAHDFGHELGCGAHLSALCRTRIGNYLIKDALTVDSFISQYQPENSFSSEIASV
jgi:tRNA pseudouridine55 synthase